MSECTHNCETCGMDCPGKNAGSLQAAPHKDAKVKKVIAVMSGKGGVGKSLVTSLLAVNAQRNGYSVGILDADITGPSIPKCFGVTERATGTDTEIYPVPTKTGIQLMSINLLLENDTDPVVWRGPVIAGAVKQFWTDVVWRDVDFLFVDMPPGTGDVPLTVFQSLPVDGIVVVGTPQELVGMIVEKAVKMAGMLNIPVLALVENMSYFECPDCGKRHRIFGGGNTAEFAKKYDIPTVAELPVNHKLAGACDMGLVELYDGPWLDEVSKAIGSMIAE